MRAHTVSAGRWLAGLAECVRGSAGFGTVVGSTCLLTGRSRVEILLLTIAAAMDGSLRHYERGEPDPHASTEIDLAMLHDFPAP